MLQTLSSRGFRPPHSPAGASLRKALYVVNYVDVFVRSWLRHTEKRQGPSDHWCYPTLPPQHTRPFVLADLLHKNDCTRSTCGRFIICDRQCVFHHFDRQCVFHLLSVCVLSFVSVCFIFCECVSCLHLAVSQAPVHSELDEHGLVEANV